MHSHLFLTNCLRWNLLHEVQRSSELQVKHKIEHIEHIEEEFES